ncbi:MAG: hypothetical protein AAF202_11700 [Pseudomonadota bacterium]
MLLRNFKLGDDPFSADGVNLGEGLGFEALFSSELLALAMAALFSDSMSFEVSSSWVIALSVQERVQTQASAIRKAITQRV